MGSARGVSNNRAYVGAEMNQERRAGEQREIKAFVQQAFQELPKFSIEQFMEFNSQISSEMFVSIMQVL